MSDTDVVQPPLAESRGTTAETNVSSETASEPEATTTQPVAAQESAFSPAQVQPPQPEINFFKASDFVQHPELTAFLKEKMSNPYNKYCIDCKKKTTSHVLLWMGIYVCADCASIHRHAFGGQSQNYIKDLQKDHWDDYQLRSLQIGGNKPFFEICKEYHIENEELTFKHRHACVAWYRKFHVSKMDGVSFNEPKPPKDWNERIQLTKSQLAKESAQWGQNLKIIGGHIKSGAAAVSQKAKEKEITQKMGMRISNVFKKKNGSIVEPPMVDDTNDDAVLESDRPETKEQQ